MKVRNLAVKALASASYSEFDQLNGEHSFKKAVPEGFVDYSVRTRSGGSVFYFNFRLAREMGLIPQSHPDEMTTELRDKLLSTFSLVIINEYDLLNKTAFDPKTVKPNRYMATRYLQLQHPNKQGKTSGDGRGIWNGEFKHKGLTWDVSSSGTGATCLSPAHAQTKSFFKTGDRSVGYGNGYNCVSDGLSAALMSEIFHQRGIETEQTLVILAFESGTSINVRAGKNLFRPAHFFRLLKMNEYSQLQAAVDYFIDRQIENRVWPERFLRARNKSRYENLAEQMSMTFSQVAADFEAEYIFCWLDWDGDNILANGGIIDYGSVRQFGLYHREYRYDDVERMSTNIPEQRSKARYIVQNFAQMRDFLVTGKKKNIRRFRNDPTLKRFDQNFENALRKNMLQKLGFSLEQTDYLIQNCLSLVKRMKKHHSYFEKTKSKRGIYEIADGVTADAIFCMADIHRELPKRLLAEKTILSSAAFVEIIKSSYAKPEDLKLGAYRVLKIKNFQQLYLRLVREISQKFHSSKLDKTLLELTMRASLKNRQDRMTGDGVLHVTSSLIRNQRKLSFQQKCKIIEQVIQHQVNPDELELQSGRGKTLKIIERNLKAIRYYREGF